MLSTLTVMHDALIKVNRESHSPDDIDFFLDHWIIVRRDGTPILNGKEQEFEQALRRLISKERQKAVNARDWHHYDVWTGEFFE